ncbi:unnamed protein product [Rhizoctonia solani]|uniref:Uncharacterized protein n=1 Tax=Rhizoctonia solani TaxID=456999 RepID=A0A8H3GRK3_9AGAM|nr:unnamed protein product [Rhizoctonia solani]
MGYRRAPIRRTVVYGHFARVIGYLQSYTSEAHSSNWQVQRYCRFSSIKIRVSGYFFIDSWAPSIFIHVFTSSIPRHHLQPIAPAICK